MLYDLLEEGPQETFNDARPLTAFPEAEAVAPTGTCAALTSVERVQRTDHSLKSSIKRAHIVITPCFLK